MNGDNIPAILQRFGIEPTAEFKRRYVNDALVYNLVNILSRQDDEMVRLRADLNDAQERSIEARNPGIDMDEVRRIRERNTERDATCPHGRHFGGHYCEECH